jgi:hypothetical protein
MRDPRSRVDAAICVPVTQMCGGKAEISCDAGLFCLEDPRVDWLVFFENQEIGMLIFGSYPDRGMCLGLCV